MYDVSVERIKQKGSDHSGRSTPQVDSHHGHREENDISSSTLDMLPEGEDFDFMFTFSSFLVVLIDCK